MHEKNEPHFTCLFIYAHFRNLSLELNMVPGVLLEPYMSQGGQGVAETPIVSKGLIDFLFEMCECNSKYVKLCTATICQLTFFKQ